MTGGATCLNEGTIGVWCLWILVLRPQRESIQRSGFVVITFCSPAKMRGGRQRRNLYMTELIFIVASRQSKLCTRMASTALMVRVTVSVAKETSVCKTGCSDFDDPRVRAGGLLRRWTRKFRRKLRRPLLNGQYGNVRSSVRREARGAAIT